MVVGLALVVGCLTRGAAAVSALLFVAFIIGIASVWARGIEIDCGCFGGGGPKQDAASKYPWEIARDVALLAASCYLVVVRRTRLALDNLLFPPAPAMMRPLIPTPSTRKLNVLEVVEHVQGRGARREGRRAARRAGAAPRSAAGS